jgi:hypothetical protein
MPAACARDLRLDFFRGLAMLIIFVAHVPGNSWTEYIPARFGFSSAAEMFVFCSGCASAIAFGSVFARCGWATGTIRIACRIWQLYWAHTAGSSRSTSQGSDDHLSLQRRTNTAPSRNASRKNFGLTVGAIVPI